MASNTHRHGQGITSGVNLNIFRNKNKWKRYIGSQAHYPPPQNTTHRNKVDQSVNIVIETEETEKENTEIEDIDISICNTTTTNADKVVQHADIILTTTEKEQSTDRKISGNYQQSTCSTKHTSSQTTYQACHVNGINYDYDKSGDLSDDDINQFVNVLRDENFICATQSEKDETESVISEAPESIFGNINLFNYQTREVEEINYDNNIQYDISKIGLGKSYIGGASRYPPRLNENSTLGAFHADLGTCTNVSLENGIIGHDLNHHEFVEIEEENQGPEGTIFMSDTNNEIISDGKNNSCIIHGINTIELVQDEVEHVLVGEEIIINNKVDKWHVHVPIRDGQGNVVWIYLFADPGANVGCVKSSWAWHHFRDYIRRNTRKSHGIKTPGGIVRPKYVLWMTFPSVTGKILKVRMYLIDELPVDILADINMLKAFGYSFKDETPPFFRHPAEPDIDLELKEQEEMFKIQHK